MSERQQLGLAAAAFVAGIGWASLRHRGHPRLAAVAVLQGLEWFVAYGGAIAVISWLRESLEKIEEPAESDERITHIRQVVTERTGTEG